MPSHNTIILIISFLLIISILNYLWLVYSLTRYGVNTDIKTNYLSETNINKWSKTNFLTFTYVYPKTFTTDKCYSEDCKINSNIIEEKIKAFHTDLYNVANKKIVIIPNEFNISPLRISINDQNSISYINKL